MDSTPFISFQQQAALTAVSFYRANTLPQCSCGLHTQQLANEACDINAVV